MRTLVNTITIFAVALLAATSECVAASDNVSESGVWQKRVRLIGAKLNEASAALSKGDKAAARKLTEDAYFAIFEAHPLDMEVMIRQEISGIRAYDIEFMFRDLWRVDREEMSVDDFRRQVATLINELRKDAIELDGGVELPPEQEAAPAAVAEIPRANSSGALWRLLFIGAGVIVVVIFLFRRRSGSKSTHTI